MESLGPPCRPGASCPPRICALLWPISTACTLLALRHPPKKVRVWARPNPCLQPPAPVATATPERVTGRQRASLHQHQQIFTLRSPQKNGPGKFWKMACREQRWRRGRANSAQISGTPWSNSCALSTARRRRTQNNDQSDCDRNFSNYARSGSALVRWPAFRIWIEAPKYFMLRQERRFDDPEH